jgi:hypothetical protein
MIHHDIEIANNMIEGSGLVASKLIAQGTAVAKLNPDDKRVTDKELQKLPKELHGLVLSYKNHTSVITTDNWKYMNHSCNPSTWWSDNETLVAMRDIHPGEEVTFDYATADVHPWWRTKWRCTCKADNCRGFIAGRDCLDPAFQERYRGHLPSWVLEFIEEQSGLRGWVMGWFAQLVEMLRRLKVAFRTNRCG